MEAVVRLPALADVSALACAPSARNCAADKAKAAARCGHQAFTDIVQQNQAAVFAYLRSRLLESTDVEDLCQEVFLRFYLGRKKLDDAASPRSWLIGIARNVIREHVRLISRRREVAWTELCLEVESMTEESPSLCEEALALLPGCLDALGPSAREALDMRYRARMNISEIAQKLLRSEGAVKLLMYRSRQALKHCLNRKLEQSRDG